MFWYNIKEEYTQLFEYVIKVLFSFQTRYLCEVEVFIYFNQSNVTEDWMQSRYERISCLLLIQTLDLQKV